MKNLKRLVLLLLVVFAIFFYKDEIGDHWLRFFSSDSSFMGKLELVRQARLNGNLDLSLQRIQTLQKQLVQEKGDYAQDDSGKRAEHQRQLSCEEAIIYKELAMTYLQQGKPMLYQDTIRLANEQFQRCAANKL